jgi:hypothetical protein
MNEIFVHMQKKLLASACDLDAAHYEEAQEDPVFGDV